MATVKFRIGTSFALALGLAVLPGCRQAQLTTQPTQPTHPKESNESKLSKHPNQPKPQAAQPSDANLKAEAISAGQELKASVKEIQATISGDDSLVADHDMVNINYASLAKLEALPGISKAQARMIINNRPYDTPLDLVYKKVITKAEYQQLVNRVVTWDNLWVKSD